MQINDFLKVLKNVKQTGDAHTARCPGHDDKINSLSIGQGDDGCILLHCHAGCSTEHILSKMELKLSDLFLDSQTDTKRIESVYSYVDENGKTLYEVVRYHPKDFRQRVPDGNGGYSYKLGNVRRVLYNLPNVISAVRTNQTVYIVEGEKDADNLNKLDYCATTNSGGAGKWRDSYSEFLSGANVVIIPDNDDPGRKHAEQVAVSLFGKAKSIRIIKLPDIPDKGDVSDFFNKHDKTNGIAILKELVDKATEWKPDKSEPNGIICLGDIEAEEVEWLWYPYIPKGKITLLQGDPGDGKTFVALAIASIVSKGRRFPEDTYSKDRECGNVIYQTAEDGLGDTLKPRILKVGGDCFRIFVIDESQYQLSLTDERIEKYMKEKSPLLLVIDPIQAYLGSGTDMHRANEVRPILAKVGRLAEKYGCAVILIMHLSKASQQHHVYRGLGSIDIAAAARSILLVGKDQKNPNERAIAHIKSSLAPIGDSIGFEIDPEYGFLWKGRSYLTADDMLFGYKKRETTMLDEAVEFLKIRLSESPVLANEIRSEAKAYGISDATLKRAKEKLKIMSIKIGYQGSYFWSLEKDSNGVQFSTDMN